MFLSLHPALSAPSSGPSGHLLPGGEKRERLTAAAVHCRRAVADAGNAMKARRQRDLFSPTGRRWLVAPDERAPKASSVSWPLNEGPTKPRPIAQVAKRCHALCTPSSGPAGHLLPDGEKRERMASAATHSGHAIVDADNSIKARRRRDLFSPTGRRWRVAPDEGVKGILGLCVTPKQRVAFGRVIRIRHGRFSS